jgi:peptidoglycan/LPS O-acetylase OafA/YrhL
MEDIAAALMLLVIFGFVAFMVMHKHQDRLEKRRLLLEAQTRILDRIGTGDALVAFLQTEEGKAILRSQEDREPAFKPGRRDGGIRMSILGLLTGGVICIGVGAGFFYAAQMTEPELYIPAGIVTGVGVACLVAAVIHFVLGMAWGLFRDNGEHNRSSTRQP